MSEKTVKVQKTPKTVKDFQKTSAQQKSSTLETNYEEMEDVSKILYSGVDVTAHCCSV